MNFAHCTSYRSYESENSESVLSYWNTTEEHMAQAVWWERGQNATFGSGDGCPAASWTWLHWTHVTADICFIWLAVHRSILQCESWIFRKGKAESGSITEKTGQKKIMWISAWLNMKIRQDFLCLYLGKSLVTGFPLIGCDCTGDDTQVSFNVARAEQTLTITVQKLLRHFQVPLLYIIIIQYMNLD